ncbi:rhodanese-like domain-containing protein [Klenkia sp. PcliD-1-E]|uniref:rhodanese-like domain-containing protein n=1 Tax=Klenkia sp. PcliD-1-E TaxID=2954492 RepID=UPI002096D19F|nr:rhodanese-like domain-containing protein [Klenkia sp. PcliD-1-E]MCO7220865.1 rhodanese-like domain-containing protein [Klenkia sp. PcliD-1-E]
MSTVPQTAPTQVADRTADVQVLDVREPDEVATGAIAGSTPIPLGQLAARAGELDRTRPVVTVCQSGRRSQQAAEALAAAGFDVANMTGGMNAWREAGLPTR